MGRPLEFDALLSTKDFEAGIKKIEDQIKGITRTTETETEKVNAIFSKFQNMAGAYFTFGFLKDFTNQLINVRGEFQRTEIAFTTMLQSQEKSNELMRELVDLAAKTPFNMSDVTDGAKRLLAFQIPAEEVTDTLRRMGDVAAGLGVPMGQLIHVYGQVKAQGKLMTNDLYQFMNAGIPILAELSKVLGKTESEIKDMVGQGKIGFEEIQQVIKGMTNEGGLFFNLMEAQSASLTGQIANLEDAIEQMFNGLGKSMEGTLSTGIEAVTYLVENYENLARVLVPLISSYGAYRTALMAVSAVEKYKVVATAQSIVTEGVAIAMKVKHIGITNALSLAMAKLNAITLANPIGLMAGAVAGLVAIMWSLDTSIKSVEETLSGYNAEMKNNKTEAESLIGVIKSETATFLEKADAVKKLQELAPETFANMTQEEIKAMDLAEAHKKLAEELENQRLAKEKITLVDMEKELASLQKLKELNVDDADGRISSRMEELRKGINELKRLDKERAEAIMAQNEPLEKQLEYWQENEKAINDEIDRIKELYPEIDITKAKAGEIPDEFAKIQTTIDNLNFSGLIARILQVQRNIANVNNQIEKANNPEKEIAPNTYEHWSRKASELEKEAKTLEKGTQAYKDKLAEVRKARGELKKFEKDFDFSEKKSQKTTKTKTKSTKSAPQYIKGSLGDLEAQLSALNNQIQNKTLVSDQKTMQKLLTQRVELEKKIAEERAKMQSKSFDEEMSELERQWKVRYMLAEKYGQEVAKAQFPDLKGESYLADVEVKLQPLDEKMKNGITLTNEEVEQWQKLKAIIDNLKGEKDPFTNWKDSLDNQLEQAETYTEKIAILQDKMVNLTPDQKGQGYEAELKQRLENEEKAFKQYYQNFLKEHASVEEKRLSISKKYADLYAKVQSEAERKKVENAQKQEESEFELNLLKESKDWDLALNHLELASKNTIKRLIAHFEEFKEKKGETLEPKELNELENVLDKLKSKAEVNPFKGLVNGIKAYREARKNLKQAEKDYNETLNDATKSVDDQRKAHNKLNTAEEKAIAKKQALLNELDKAQAGFNALMEGAKDLTEAFGGMSEATADALEDLSAIGNAAFDLGKSLASGDIFGAIGGTVKLIGKIAQAFSGDKRKERQIKREENALKNLKTAYEDLAHAANKAFGERKYNSQTGLIQNLEQQKVHLQNMIHQENRKKKTDHGKIADWQGQISAINRSIDDIKTDVIRDVLQTDVVDAAAKVGDALVEAFGKGEDAVESLDKVANDMLKNMLKNQLNLRLQEQMKPILDKMMKQSGIDEFGRGSFGGFTKAQMQNFKDEVRRSGEQMQGFLEAYREIFQELENNADQSLKGSIQGITEQTADVLAGQINAIRMNIGEILKNSAFNLEVVRESIVILTQIEYHTRNLHQIKKDISEMNSKMGNNSVLRANG